MCQSLLKLKTEKNYKPIENCVVTLGSKSTDISIEKNFYCFDTIKIYKLKLFKEKGVGLDYIKNSKDTDLILIAEDIGIKFGNSKKYWVCKRDFIYTILKDKLLCIYEGIDYEENVKLHIDVDLKEEHIVNNRDDDLDDYIDKIYTLVSNVLYEKYQLENQRCIVLKSINKTGKSSAHMIFPDIVFDNVYCIKYMFSEVKSSLIENKILDPSVYRAGFFRFLWAKKIGKDNNLEYYKGINYELSKSKKDLFDDCMICYNNKNVKILKHDYVERLKKEKKDKIVLTNRNFISIYDKEPNWINLYTVKELKQLLDILSIKRCDDYISWSMIGMALYNCNNSIECLKLFDEWSKLNPDKYDINGCRFKWLNYRKKTIDDININYLKNCAKKDNPEKFCKLKAFNKQQKTLFETEKINKQFLIDKNDKNDEMIKTIDNFFTLEELRILCLISAYGTGKTKLVKDAIEKYKPKKILWVTHRQTLTYDLFGSLKDNNINVYLNGFPYNKYSCLYTIDDVGNFHGELRRKNDINKTSLFDIINNYNELENLNKNKSTFITCLLELLIRKGHKYLFDHTLFKKKKKKDNNYTKDSILKAKDIMPSQYEILLNKQKNNEATEDDKLSIIKYCYKYYWKVEEVNKKFLNDAFRNTHILFNLKSIIKKFNKLDDDIINDDLFDNLIIADEYDEYLDYKKTKINERMEIVMDLIKKLGFNDLTEKTLLTREQFELNKENIKENVLFKNQDYSLPLFNMKKKKIITNKAFLGFINTVLDNYGLAIGQKRKTLEKNENMIVFYCLKIDKNYSKYI
jgi:hypothetical protein